MSVFQYRELSGRAIGSAHCLDAIETAPDTGTEHGVVFFDRSVRVDAIDAGDATEIQERRSVGDAPILFAKANAGSLISLSIEGDEQLLELTPAETDLFADMRVGFAVRNGENAQVTLDWLAYHAKHQGMTAALIVDRAQPETDAPYLDALQDGIAAIDAIKRLVVVRCNVPLGAADLPAEAHPYCAPDAPGKDRMEIPPASPWDSPLGVLNIYELMRYRFLEKARSVALLDISDLIMDQGDHTVFELAETSEAGCITLIGQHCYPWRVRNGDMPHYSDHICIQFDAQKARRRWCVAPAKAGPKTVWRMIRVVGAEGTEWRPFYRFMGLRHPADTVSKIVPKSSLIENDTLMDLAKTEFGASPVRMPEIAPPDYDKTSNNTTIITTMKNEGPFILEWLAYHRVIGVKDFLVYTNDCSDGTDTFLELLQEKGYCQHRDNRFEGTGLKPQHHALQCGEKEPVIQNADWVVCMDVDEYINIKTGDGTLKALFEAVPDANMISMTWRLFGNGDVHEFTDEPITGIYDRCAFEMTRKPHQAWGFKTLFRNIGLFKKLGVHRPKGLNPQLWNHINWVNGSGRPMPKDMYRNAWRSTGSTVGYDLVSLNHYAVRSAESFLVKRDRGRVNHVDRDQGLSYWFRMNNNSTEERSIMRMLPKLRAEMDRMLEDPEIRAAHEGCVAAHRSKIDELKATENYTKFYGDLTGARMERLARMHRHFGANVFLAGPDVVPDEVVFADHPEDFFFTVERQETTH